VKRLLAIALVSTVPLLVLGCGGDTPTKPRGGDRLFVFPDRSTPNNTILRMEIAFSARDSVVTASVYSDNYEGSSDDFTDPTAVHLTFTKADEVRVVAELARSTSIVQSNVDLGISSGWFHTHYVTDPAGWVSIQVPAFSIYVNDAARGEYATSSPSPGVTQIFEFTLEPTTPDPSSPTDTTWTIVRWVESRSHI